jgi:acyl-CoA reductase-like NAD-dependent aldehyde dehydrogenase
MTISARHGSPQFPIVAGSIPSSTQAVMDEAISTLQAHKATWIALSISDRVALLDRLTADFAAIAPRWVAESAAAKGLAEDSPFTGEEWGAGVWPVVKNLRQLRQSLTQIERKGHPTIPGALIMHADGQMVAQVFPQSLYDRLFFGGITAQVWMEPGITAAELPKTQAVAYQKTHQNQHGKVNLVLGAGNVSSICPMDILYKLFVENQVVLLKTNPVNAYLGPLIEESFRALVEPGFLRVVYGGAEEGKYLCNHPGIDEIHITGSDKTFDAIVFGTGTEGTQRKAAARPLLTKPITGELGNVSPVIVVPGPWSESDITYQSQHIASMLTNNAGFNCNATRVIIQHQSWTRRDQLLRGIRHVLRNVPLRNAYYPGAKQRQQSFLDIHPEAEQYGTAQGEQLPWTLIAGVDPTRTNDICFTMEAFCGLFAETMLEAEGIPAYIDSAVEFANEHIWGTLNATILVHPRSLADPAIATALERAVSNLRYGTIGVNYWAGIGYALGVTTWGAFPGHALNDIQSGTGVVHNTLMFSRPQKSVLRAPFRSTPTPPWFVTQGKVARKIFPKLVDLEASPSPAKVPGILWTAMRGA